VPERRDLLLLEGGAGGDRTMESGVQHGAAAFVAGLQATGAKGNPAQARGAWRCGKRSAFPTSPPPRRRLRTNFKRGATLTIYLVQKIGQVNSRWSSSGINAFESPQGHIVAATRWIASPLHSRGLTISSSEPNSFAVRIGGRFTPGSWQSSLSRALLGTPRAAENHAMQSAA